MFITGFVPALIYGQLIRTEYYNSEWEKTYEKIYDYKREIFRIDSLYLIKDYDIEGKIRMIGEYLSIDTLIEHGHFQFFNKKAFLDSEGYYENGTMIGIWKYYDKKGKVKIELNYDLNDIQCDSPIEEKEKQSKENQYYIIDNIIPLSSREDFSVFELFVSINMISPPMASIHLKPGLINVNFTVDSDGYVCNVKADGDVNKELLYEAKRVVLTSPRWQPASQDGKPVAQQFSLPITINPK